MARCVPLAGRRRCPARLTPRRRRLVAVAVLAAACDTGAPAGTPPITPGTSAAPREVNVVTRDYAFVPSVVDLAPGETVLLHVVNFGLEEHEAVFGTLDAQLAWEAGEEADRRRIRPGPTPFVAAARGLRRASGSSSGRGSGSTSPGRSRPTRPTRRAAGSWAATSRVTGRRAWSRRSGWSARTACPWAPRRRCPRSAPPAAELAGRARVPAAAVAPDPPPGRYRPSSVLAGVPETRSAVVPSCGASRSLEARGHALFGRAFGTWRT